MIQILKIQATNFLFLGALRFPHDKDWFREVGKLLVVLEGNCVYFVVGFRSLWIQRTLWFAVDHRTYFLVFQAALGVGTSDPLQFRAASKPVWETLMLDASFLIQIPK